MQNKSVILSQSDYSEINKKKPFNPTAQIFKIMF